MATYTVQAPDGKTITLEGPEGASQADVIAQAQRLYSGGGQAQAAPAAPEEDKGLMYNSFVRGLVYDPIAAIREMTGGEEARKQVAAEEAAYQRYRQQKGDEGFEWGRLAGGVALPLPGAGLVKGAGALAKLGRAAAFGGGVAATQPVFNADQDTSFVGEKLFQVGGGLALGAATKAAFGAVRGGKEFLSELMKPMSEKGRQQLIEDFLAKITDPADRAKIVKALNAAEQDIVPGSRATAAQALADTPEAANILALQAKVEPSARPQFAARELEQQAAQRAALEPFSDLTRKAQIEAERDAVTGAQRTQALEEANRAGPTIQAAQARAQQLEQEALDMANQPLKQAKATTIAESMNASKTAADAGDAVAAKRAEAAMFRNQAEQLMKDGRYFLSPDRLVQRIEQFMQQPGKRADTVLMKGLATIAKEIKEQSRFGVIDAQDLYQIRRNINQSLMSQFKTPQATPSVQVLAGHEKTIKQLIDAEINKAGPSGMWNKYMKDYQKYSKQANQIEIGNYLKGKLGEAYVTDIPNAGAFYNAVQDAAKTIQRAGIGGPRYSDLGKVMTGEQMKAIHAVRDDLARAAKAKMRTKPSTAVGGDITTTPELPPLLSRTATIVNAVIKHFKGDAVEAMNKKFAELMLEPKLLATAISNIEKKNAPGFIQAIFPKLTPENQRALIDAIGIGGAVDLANTPPPAM